MIESPEAVVVGTTQGVAGNFEVHVGDMLLVVSAPIRYYAEDQKRPKKHQLLVEFEDGTAITSSAQMGGGFPDYDIAKTRPSPLTGAFDRAYFDTLFNADTPKLSAKVFLVHLHDHAEMFVLPPGTTRAHTRWDRLAYWTDRLDDTSTGRILRPSAALQHHARRFAGPGKTRQNRRQAPRVCGVRR
jgi:hypothetical protein